MRCSRAKRALPGPAHALTLASLERAAGGTTCDRVTVREWTYAADAGTGALQLDARVVREFGVREAGRGARRLLAAAGERLLRSARAAKHEDSRDADRGVNRDQRERPCGTSKPLNKPTRSVGAHTSSSHADDDDDEHAGFRGRAGENPHQCAEQHPASGRRAVRPPTCREPRCASSVPSGVDAQIAANASGAKNAWAVSPTPSSRYSDPDDSEPPLERRHARVSPVTTGVILRGIDGRVTRAGARAGAQAR